MNLLQGNTYNLNISIKVDGQDIDINNISKIQFVFGEVEKVYNGTSQDVTYAGNNTFIVKLSQADTFKLKDSVEYQIRIKFTNGEVKGTIPQIGAVTDSITEEVL